MTRYLIIKQRQRQADTVLRVKSDLTIEKLFDAAHEAVADFLKNGGREADTALSATNGKFTWSDLAMWLPDRYQEKHGFEIKDATTELYNIPGDMSLLPNGEAQYDPDDYKNT